MHYLRIENFFFLIFGFVLLVNYISRSKRKIVEGQLRCQELKDYLTQLKFGSKVWLCEDATGLSAKIEYDSSTDQLVGIALPINTKTGMPQSYTFLARSVEDIQKHAKEPQSGLVYLILAQPIMPNAPPFVIQVFGTNNKFSSTDVKNRWKYTIRELEKYGIEVEGVSADGDSRLLKSMIDNMNRKNAIENLSEIDLKGILCLQDIVHIATKLRNRLLALIVTLILGCSIVSLSHLKMLINNVSKEIHGLTMKDICPDDRQNFGSMEKMMKQRVIDALEEHVVGSKGTVMYLKLCGKITSSLMENNLPPLERIHRLWYSTFFLRAWKKWLNRSGLKIKDSFISQNAHSCIEVNAENLIKLTVKFREQKCESLYIPTLFNSQPCEETFRAFRSMGTMNYTRINFTLLELFHLVGRVELQNDIVYIKLADQDISFPRNKINEAQLNQYKLPSDSEIINAINEAKKDAIEDAGKFGIDVEPTEIEQCEFKNTSEENLIDDEIDADVAHIPEQSTESSAFIDITLNNGTKKSIRKSTYLWTLTDPRQHLSNDRLKRVQEAKEQSKHKKKQISSKPRRLVFRKELSPNPILSLCKNEELQIGDWAIFQIEIKKKVIFAVGNILSFRYRDGKTAKERKYTWDFAPIVPPKGVKARGIEVMASWFEIGSATIHAPVDLLNSFYIDIEKYIATLDCSSIKLNDSGCLTFIDEVSVLQIIQDKLSQLSQKTKK